jgi:tRNA pseudouridine55 synthase
MIPSLLLLDKPKGITSFQLVDAVKKKFKLNKVGHTGTLDPIATGLLILLLEEATRFAEFFVRLPKTYITKIILGAITDTYDAEGNILERRDVNISCEDVARVLPNFTGRILQKPPPYSAKKVGGVRAYELAKKGLEAPLKPVEVEVYRAKLLECNLPQVVLEFEVSGGTYIRSLAHDIGLALGCGAYVSELRRTKVGDFSVSMALSYERLNNLEDLWGVLIPIWEALSFLPGVSLRAKEARLFRNGAKVRAEVKHYGYVRVFWEEEFLGVGLLEGGFLKPYRLMPLK